MNKKLTFLLFLELLLFQSPLSYAQTLEEHIHKGNIYLAAKNFKSAKKEFSDALKLNAHNSEAHRGMGDVLFFPEKNLNGANKAETEYTKAIYFDSGNAKAHCGLARVYLRMRKYNQAELEAEKALEIDPKYADAQYVIAVVYNHRADEGYYKDKDQVKVMISAYRKVIELDPDHDAAVHNLSLEYVRKGDYDTAIKLRMEFLGRHPNDVRSLLNIAETYRLSQKYDDAIKYCDKILAIDHKDRSAKDLIEKSKADKASRQKIVNLTYRIADDFLSSSDPNERAMVQQLKDGRVKEVLSSLKEKIVDEKKDGRSCFFFALASFLDGNHKDASIYSATAFGLKYQNKYLSEFDRLTFAYDLSLTPFIQ